MGKHTLTLSFGTLYPTPVCGLYPVHSISTAFVGTCMVVPTSSCLCVYGRCSAMFFFQFLDGARVASIHLLIYTDFSRLVIIFQGIVKTVASSHKCGDILHKKTICCPFQAIFPLRIDNQCFLNVKIWRKLYRKKELVGGKQLTLSPEHYRLLPFLTGKFSQNAR